MLFSCTVFYVHRVYFALSFIRRLSLPPFDVRQLPLAIVLTIKIAIDVVLFKIYYLNSSVFHGNIVGKRH